MERSSRYEDGEEAVRWCLGYKDFLWIAEHGSDLRTIGCILCWMVWQGRRSVLTHGRVTAVLRVLCGSGAGLLTVHRSRKGIFPLRVGGFNSMLEAFEKTSWEDIFTGEFKDRWSEEAWTFCSVQFVNYLHGSRAFDLKVWRDVDRRAVESLRASVARMLAQDDKVEGPMSEIEKELTSRFMTYTGEEIPKMEMLSVDQILPALPPEGHGGAIKGLDWVRGRTRIFLGHPEDCIRPDDDRVLPKLQARVHIVESGKLALARLLVDRGICGWTKEVDVFRYRGEMVLNGLFGVPKSTLLQDGRPVLRLIMNLIPSNSTMLQVEGLVKELPAITQYLSIVVETGETLTFSQSDMTSAFYLFGLPEGWKRFLCFNLRACGNDLGLKDNGWYYLSCAALPMGWSSAVAVMQEISTELLLRGGLPESSQVKRTRSLPAWLCESLATSKKLNKCWWHVYLDNFRCGEKKHEGQVSEDSVRLHELAENIWEEAGVLSSKKKQVRDTEIVDELGARFIKFGDGKRLGGPGVLLAREELFACMLGGGCLFHTFLGSQVSEIASASDASGTGGAVGMSRALQAEGKEFCAGLRQKEHGVEPQTAPILVVSLFNGIGGTFRSYDILGVEVAGMISYDTSKMANRITSWRWPSAVIREDVRSIDESTVRGWFFQFPHIIALHLWAGFPCVDLRAVRFGRKNLAGACSSLFFEVTRIIALIRRIFGSTIKVIFFVENVASMDREAAEEISAHLGVIPFRLQCSQVTPISRPRYCWTNTKLEGLPGIRLVRRDYYVDVLTERPMLETYQWLEEGCSWEGDALGVVFPIHV